jgi:hypothetical protein
MKTCMKKRGESATAKDIPEITAESFLLFTIVSFSTFQVQSNALRYASEISAVQ